MPNLLHLTAALALAASGAGTLEVRDVEVSGNGRTDRAVIVRALGVRPGDLISGESLDGLRQQVMNLRLFEEVEVATRPSGDGVVLTVSVKERWTLIPIPIVGASDGAFRAGAAVLESNLLGRHKLLMLSAIYSSRGPSAIVLYRDPALLGSRALLAAELIAGSSLRERVDAGEVVYAWRDRRVEASVRPGLEPFPRLRLRAGPFFSSRTSRAEPGYAPPPPAGLDLGLAAEVEYDGQDHAGWFEAGPKAGARVRSALPALGSDRRFTQLNAQASWVVRALRDHAASATLAGFLADGDPILDAFLLGGRPGSRGLRQEGLWVERGATATVDYQVPVWRPGWGTVTTGAFLDAGVSTWRGERTRYVAPGAGFRVYLRRIALPAMGLDFAWSTAGRGVGTSFFLGFGA
ncbi:MAG TPA: POTRA domain-containing protein [Anaeromyxobacteraceae bacterium]|nr:POTRA domain-containing protein [Anaeromyxobacteraceae bacterium]